MIVGELGKSEAAERDRERSGRPARSVVVIPTYNERQNLERLVSRILILRPDLDVLVVDDNSPDGTGEIADALARGEPRVSVIHRERKGGLATAYLAGFRYALAHEYEYIVQMDADFSHRVEDLGSLIAAAEAADVVIGSRNVEGGQAVARSPVRRLVSRLGSLYARALLGIPVWDCTGGFKCFSRRALLRVDLGAVRRHR